MRIFNKFYPVEISDSAYKIDYQKYYDEGYRGILFDIDNTLVPHGAPADNKAIKLFKKLREIGCKWEMMWSEFYLCILTK